MAYFLDHHLEMPVGAYPPDPWLQGDDIALRLDAVITRGGDGQPLSYVGDFVWDWEFYHPRRKASKLIFYFWTSRGKQNIDEEYITPRRLAIIRELQYLMVLRVYHSEQLLGFSYLNSCLGSLCSIAIFAEKNTCSVRDVLEQANLIDLYISSLAEHQCTSLVSWIIFLKSLDSVSVLGFDVANAKRWAELKRRTKQYRANRRQHAPLPTRIYSDLINSLSNELDEVEAIQDRIFASVREGVILYAKHYASGETKSCSFGVDLVERYGLVEVLEKRECTASLLGLIKFLTEIFRLCKIQIHIFSGMRSEEVNYLPYHCMEVVATLHGRMHSLIVGVTTKLVGSRRRRTRWVTTESQGFRAIRMAQAFANVVYESLGITPSVDDHTKDNYPLFISTAYLPWGVRKVVPQGGQYQPARLGLCELSDKVRARLCAIIEEDDIAELEAVDPFRAWNSEPEFIPGQMWKLKSHQFRRSLTLYGNSSGLVQVSSLRRQLQHITQEMSEYYGRGSVFAKNFLSDDAEEFSKHICVEWQDAEQEAQYLAFTRDVLNSAEPLCGPGGRFYDLQKQRGEVISPQEIKEQLKMGRLAYKGHPLGGCTQVGACDKQKGLRLTGGICISEHCKSLIGKHSKIVKLIPIQAAIVRGLDPRSIAYEMEKEELDILEEAEVQWQADKRPISGSPIGRPQ